MGAEVPCGAGAAVVAGTGAVAAPAEFALEALVLIGREEGLTDIDGC